MSVATQSVSSTSVASHLRTRIFGLETEYTFAAFGPNGVRFPPGPALSHLLEAVRDSVPSLPDRRAHVGMFLANGSRLYIDSGHPELATAETTSPTDLCRQVLAGDRVLAAACERITQSVRGLKGTFLARNNVGYLPYATTWGCHESYSYTSPPAEIQQLMLPHLVSRVIYTGAGGFDNQSAGIEFLLSPRVAHLRKAVSERSTTDRGIFHSKFEPLNAAGQHRLHVICGEGLRSHTAMWLKAATTALLLALHDVGISATRLRTAVTLADPVGAMRTFAADPTGRATAPTANGKERLTALEIQRRYLEIVEQRLDEPTLPEWSPLACRRWRDALDLLEHAPDAVSRTFDWGIKRELFAGQVRRAGFDDAAIPAWNHVLRQLRKTLEDAAENDHEISTEITKDVLSPNHVAAPKVRALAPHLKAHGLSWDRLEAFLKLRQDLFALDTRFSQIGGAGLFEAMDGAGVLNHALDDVTDVAEAAAAPPRGSRAELRGREIIRLHAQKAARPVEKKTLQRPVVLADWEGIWDYEKTKVLSLDNPFSTAADWREMTDNEKFEHHGSAAPMLGRMLNGVLTDYDHGRYERASQSLQQIARVAHLLVGQQRRDYCRYTAWVQSRRGFLDADGALREAFADETEDLNEIADIVCGLRYQGLCPPATIERWLERTERLLVASPESTATAIPILGHIAFHRLRQGKPRKALRALRTAQEANGFEQIHPHVRARVLAEQADALRMLGWSKRAKTSLDTAEAIHREHGYEGDLADLTLTYRAKLTDDPQDALRLLAEAKAIQTRLGNRMGEARTWILEARLSADRAAAVTARKRLIELRRALPALKRCRLMRLIAKNWRAWVAGENPHGLRDRYWCL